MELLSEEEFDGIHQCVIAMYQNSFHLGDLHRYINHLDFVLSNTRRNHIEFSLRYRRDLIFCRKVALKLVELQDECRRIHEKIGGKYGYGASTDFVVD